MEVKRIAHSMLVHQKSFFHYLQLNFINENNREMATDG